MEDQGQKPTQGRQKAGAAWKDAPPKGDEGQAPAVQQKAPTGPIISREQAVADVAMALTILGQHTGLQPEVVERALMEARHQELHQPKQVPMLDADAYTGPLYSARNILDGSLLWAIKLPMMTKMTQEHEGRVGVVFGKPGDFLVWMAAQNRMAIVPADNFQGIYQWVPDSVNHPHGAVAKLPERQTGVDRATMLEQSTTMDSMAEYAKLYLEAWGTAVTCMLQDGRLTVQPPAMDMTKATIIQPPEVGDQPQYAWTLTRYGNGYMMVTDVTGSQFPLIQGKVVDMVPRFLDMVRKTEGLECYGTFSWSSRGADNFVRKYMAHGKDLLTQALKDEWQMAYYLLKKHSEYLAHPELLDQEPKADPPRKKVERRRQPRQKQPTKAQLQEAWDAEAQASSSGPN